MFLWPLLFLALCFLHLSKCQDVNPAFRDPDDMKAINNRFYFTSKNDCNLGKARDLHGYEGHILGYDISSSLFGPKSCTIILTSTGQFDGTILEIMVKAMDFQDARTTVAIYDGFGTETTLLMSYNLRTRPDQNWRSFRTTGNTASFVMVREQAELMNFDVQIIVTPIRGGSDPGWENEWGGNNPFAFDKFDQRAIVGIIGGFYLLVVLICIGMLVYYARKLMGLNKEWETHQLAAMKTDTNFDGRSTMTQPSQVFATEMASRPRGYTQPYPRKNLADSEDGDSGVFYNDDGFQSARLMNDKKPARPPKYATNNSFADTEEDNFKEKIITPRVRTNRNRNARPPSYEEAVSDHPSDRSSEEEESEASGSSYGKRPPSSDEERSNRSRSSRSDRSRSTRSTRSATPSETESESGSEDGSRRGRGARARRPRKKPKKNQRRRSREELDDDDASSSRRERRHPPPQQAMPPQGMPYGAYPPGQFIPVMAGPPQFQPVQMMPGYPPPRYHEEQQPPAQSQPLVQPTDPPVYSYLVRRGYTPLDQRSNSLASTEDSHRSGHGRLDEPDTRLESGVEYMRR